ncbi:MAG: c-type cytochrome [Verrucomicrobiaceae bacterium]|nr:c-type cytochrome [Verrucomicrobiaceae bacterium]
MRLLSAFLLACSAGLAVAEPFELKLNDVIALAGGSNIERTRFNGYLQTSLIASKPELKIKVRNFGWEGDTVFEQWRDGGNYQNLDPKRAAAEKRISAETGTDSWRQQRDWRQQLKEAGATVVIAQFGQMESLNGVEKLPQFIEAYENLIAEFADEGRRVVLVSPVPFEGSLEAQNAAILQYSQAVKALADRLRQPFINLSSLMMATTPRRMDNGYQLNEAGHHMIANMIVEGLGLKPVTNEAVRAQVLEFERLWFDYWRPMNWSFLMGDRTNVPYSRDWKDSTKRLFPQEMQDFLPLLDQAEKNIWAAMEGKPVTPIGVRSSIPVEPPTAKPQSPEEELASFQIMDGFAVNLFASEADGIVKPIQMRWDERGRLWVACAVSYPQIKPGEKANDYVLVCEDTDGDGKADKFHKFVEGLFMPAGLELGDGGLYVAQGTELLHFKDTDGDDKADTKRIVLGGFGTADSHQMINCINWGFGGELWFTQGHHIYSRVETPYGVETLNRAGVWRYRPRTSHLDPFFQWSSAGANCWGVTTTEYGQAFHKSGANIGSWFTTPGMVRSDLAVNAQAMNLCLAPIKQVGQEFLHSSMFPKEMQGRIVIGGYYANLLEWHELKFENGMFSTTRLPNIIETKNNVFRPVEVRMGPDGGIYVADWYNPIIGHYQASYRHPDRDKEHGRIWRVTWKTGTKVNPVNLVKQSAEKLLEHLDSKERWAWYQTKRLLIEHDTKEVLAALETWTPKQNDYRKLQALSLYEAHESPRPELLKALLRSTDARIRAYATRTLSTWARDGRLPDALTLLEAQIADEDALVRLEAIVAASYIADARSAVIAARALDKEFNGYHLHALTKTLHVLNPLWSAKPAFEKDEHLIFALQNGWVENNPNDLKNLSGAAIAYAPNSNAKAAAIMREQIAKHEGDPERQTKWLKALAGTASGDDVAFIFERAGQNAAVLAALKAAKPENAEKLLTPLFEAQNPALRAQGIRLAGAWKVSAFTESIRKLALEQKQPQALDTLISLKPDEVAALALKDTAMLSTLVSRTEGHAALMRALQKKDALDAAQAKKVLQTLNNLGKNDAKLSPLLMKLAGINSALPTYTKEYIANIVKGANTFGNAAEGKKIYEAAGCIACHTPGPANSKIGPDLSAIARGLPIDMIVTEVVWPALNVKENFEAATVTLKDGTVITGFKQTDTADTLTIRDLTGAMIAVKKSDAQKIQTGGSLMPDGLTAGMNEQQLAHLVKYLSELGK